MKTFSKVTLLLALTLTLSLFACKDEPPAEETPKVQDSPNVPMFAGKTAHITTNDTFTDTQWNKICSDIAGKFSAGYTNDGYGEAYEEAIGLLTEIIVEKNPTGYSDYQYIKGGVGERKLYVCATKVNNINVYNVVEAILNAKDLIATPRLNRLTKEV